ncbi:NADPH-dependent FMN reductase [Denitrovibrio acetiphilus DSM 12809]|uniref:NADPH-dependent FMN reductase n=1 Tax=Denitrovibrio acetiphilus (strain DSM 12809 / NBRC 114555 / N2460) TaxID=522772 RepID=D4H2G9_DENA2|nr:flavodoxin family protein [Denitrovibrio acetiphilus]ADD67030.1 NADPH-dependent FMN reductase [Denitrovibrio acetiphilus DSM 12809]
MKAIAICGSPRKNGNTETMLNKVLSPLNDAGWETELVKIGGKPVRGCLACGKCYERKNKRCIIESDCINDCLEKIFAADAVILGSPTYFTDVTSEMKGLLDRTGFVSQANGHLLKGKIGAAVVAVRRGGATHVYDTINHMFLMSSMIVPGSIYWNIGVALNEGEVLKDDEAMRNMNHLGQVINWLGKSIKTSGEQFPAPPAGVKE